MSILKTRLVAVTMTWESVTNNLIQRWEMSTVQVADKIHWTWRFDADSISMTAIRTVLY